MTDEAPFVQVSRETIGVAFVGTAARCGGARLSTMARALDEVAAAGWQLSVQEMLGGGQSGAFAYDVSATSDADVAGLFEAPSLELALWGLEVLESGGWNRLMSTEWLLGPREFAAVGVRQPNVPCGFLALWEWNDAWCQATTAEREIYDNECDVAFREDLDAGIGISGRHRIDYTSRWHQMAAWDVDSPERLNTAMHAHERVGDFRFTTSRHYVGLRTPLLDILGDLGG